jgi:hypothetical protein
LTGKRTLSKMSAVLRHLKLAGFNNKDNIVKYRALIAVPFLLYMILLNGCASQMSLEDLGRHWIARPLSELKQEMKSPDSYASKIGWKETTYPLSNGNFVYVEPVSADCSVHWEINQSGIIVGYRAKGNGCKGGGHDNSVIKTQTRE